MNFNMRRYEKRKFHEDPDIDKKIKALYLWFDYQTFIRGYTYKEKLKLTNKWIPTLKEYGEEEVSRAFEVRKLHIENIIGAKKRAIRLRSRRLSSFYRLYRLKIYKFVKNFSIKGLYNPLK